MGDDITYKTVAKALGVVLVTLIMGIGGYLYADMDKRVKSLEHQLPALATNVYVIATYMDIPKNKLIAPASMYMNRNRSGSENKMSLGIK